MPAEAGLGRVELLCSGLGKSAIDPRHHLSTAIAAGMMMSLR
jgi:hypothetical protein